jgi:hypothetical protein
MIRPDAPGKFPLIVCGKQRGYAAVSNRAAGVRSPLGSLCNTDYLRVGLISGEDVAGSVAALRREPWVQPDRIVLLGFSSGGLAVSAATNP